MKRKKKASTTRCQMKAAPFYQCCCNCVYHLPVHYHCSTEPKPSQKECEKFNLDGSCVCRVRKGWCCVGSEDRVYDNWGEHSVGCELYTPKKKNG